MGEVLAGRHIVVTGGGGALGRVVVERLLRAGADCHVPVRRAEGGKRPERLHVVAGVDLTDQAAVDAFYDALPVLWGSVHLAGGFAMAPLAGTDGAAFMHMLEMNTLTTFLCARAAARSMRRSDQGGRIVSVAARPGLEPRQGARMAAYATSKAAVVALTQALAEELKKERILVNAIAPSTLDTPANRQAMPAADTSAWLAPEAAAEAILHLVSPENREISGAILPLYARA